MQDGCVHSGGCCIDTEDASPLTVARLEHDAACAHALMLAMGGIRSEWVPDGPPILSEIVTRADELLREWGFDSGEERTA
jgi:hypothetical protein